MRESYSMRTGNRKQDLKFVPSPSVRVHGRAIRSAGAVISRLLPRGDAGFSGGWSRRVRGDDCRTYYGIPQIKVVQAVNFSTLQQGR